MIKTVSIHPKLCKFKNEEIKQKTVSEAAMKLMAMAQGINSDDDSQSSVTSNSENNINKKEEVINITNQQNEGITEPKLKDRLSTKCDNDDIDRDDTDNTKPELLNRASINVKPQMCASRNSNQR